MLEVRRGECSPYPLYSVYQVLCDLRHARSHWKDCPNFMDKQNSELHGCLARELRQDGVEEEYLLWDSGAVGIFNSCAMDFLLCGQNPLLGAAKPETITVYP